VWSAGPVRVYFGEPGHVHILCLRVSVVWGAGLVRVYFVTFNGVGGETVRVFYVPCSVLTGTVRLK
jgi:hypothetical protein